MSDPLDDIPTTEGVAGIQDTVKPDPESVIKEQDTVLRPNSVGGLTISRPTKEIATFNMLLYGDPGAGKTRLAASVSAIEELKPVLLIDVEGGTLTLNATLPDVDIVKVNNYVDFVALHKQIKADGYYKTVIIDSITEVQKLGMYTIMDRAVARAAEEGDERDPDLPGIGEWGKNANQTRKLIRAFRDLPCNTIMTALAQTDNTRRNAPKAKPSLNGKMADEIAGFLDIVLYQYKKLVSGEIRHIILSSGTEDIVAKDRSDRLPITIENAEFTDMWAYLSGEKAKPTPTPNTNTNTEEG